MTDDHDRCECVGVYKKCILKIFHVIRRMVENFVPSVLARYRQQILFPILRLFVSVLMTLGTDNQYAVSRVSC